MSDEFQFPDWPHVTEIVEEGGKLYEEARTPPVCDFCSDTRVLWDYETDEFMLKVNDEIDFASAEGWAVCGPCAEHIEARNLPELTGRMLRSWTAMGNEVDASKIDAAGQIAQAFFDHLHPGRVAFG